MVLIHGNAGGDEARLANNIGCRWAGRCIE
jgi:hypothetical protein